MGEVGVGGVLFGDHLPERLGQESFGSLIRSVVDARGGTLLEQKDHGTQSEFVGAFSVVGQAVAAAIDLYRAALVEDQESAPRFGVGFGEYMISDRGGFGSVIIEAVRLQHQADGHIALSARTRNELPEELLQHLRAEGEWALKGFDDPVKAFTVKGLPDVPSSPVWQPVSVLMSIDIIGSTELLGRIGGDAAIALHRDFLAMLVDTGLANSPDDVAVVLDQRGDGAIIQVRTATEGLDRALRLQSAMLAYPLRADAVADFAIRIGIAAGSRPVEIVEAEAVAIEAAAGSNEIHVDPTVAYLARDLKQLSMAPAGNNLGSLTVVSEQYNSRLSLPPSLGIRRDVPLVGRDREIAELTERWRRTMAGAASFAAVVGDSGMGKTRLVAEFAQVAVDEGARVLFGWNDAEWQEPFGPFFEALTLADHDGSELRRFAAQMSANAGEANDGDRIVFFDQVCRQLRALAQIRPLVFVLDDLHWATTATMSLLRHVMRELADDRLFVIGTYRPSEVSHDGPVREFEAELRRGVPPPALIEVGGISNDAVVALLSEYVDSGSIGPQGTELAYRVHVETGGSPFFTRELLSHMASGGTLELLDRESSNGAVDASVLPIPESLRDVVRQRVAFLDADAPSVLAQASVIGERFSLEVLALLLETDIEIVLDLLEKAEQASLLVEADRPREYRFAHAIVRTTLLDGLTPTRRSLVHERLGVLLEDLPGDHLDQLTFHWQQAGGSKGPLKAAKYLQLAAKRDAQSLDWESAATRYRSLLEMVETAPDRQELAIETWLGLGHVLRALGDPEYLDAMKTAGRLARSLGNNELLAQAAIGAMKPGSWFANANETDELIIGFCEEAANGLNPIDPLRLRLLAILATSLAFEDGRDRREKYAYEAVALGRTLGDSGLLASALVAEHLSLWDPTTFDRRGEIATELDRLARRRDDKEVGFLAGFFHASWLLEQGRVPEAKAALTLLEEPIAQTGNFWFRFLVDRMVVGLGIACGDDGMPAAVDALFERAAPTQADAPGTWAAQLGGLAINDDRFGTMVESLRGAAERSRGQGIWSYAYVVALLHAGEDEAARTAAVELRRPNVDFMWTVSMQFLAEIGYGLSDTGISTEAYEALLPYRGRLGVIASGTLTYDFVSTSLGAAALGMGKPALAIPLLEEAVAHAERAGLRFPQIRSERLLAKARSAG